MVSTRSAAAARRRPSSSRWLQRAGPLSVMSAPRCWPASGTHRLNPPLGTWSCCETERWLPAACPTPNRSVRRSSKGSRVCYSFTLRPCLRRARTRHKPDPTAKIACSACGCHTDKSVCARRASRHVRDRRNRSSHNGSLPTHSSAAGRVGPMGSVRPTAAIRRACTPIACAPTEACPCALMDHHLGQLRPAPG
jgi:hypothetical protein